MSSARIAGVIGGEPVHVTMFGARGTAAIGPIQIIIDLREGRINDATPAPPPRLIDGSVLVAVRLFPQLSVGIGPQGRAYITDAPTVYHIWGAGSGHLELPLAGPTVRTDVWLWHSFATRTVDALDHVAGGEVGIALGPPDGWGVRLATRFDDIAFDNGRRERLVALTLGAGYRP